MRGDGVAGDAVAGDDMARRQWRLAMSTACKKATDFYYSLVVFDEIMCFYMSSSTCMIRVGYV